MNNRNLSLKPIRLAFAGTGNPCDNDPRTKAERSFSQNLIYLCKKKPKTAKELSDELCVPMPFVEEELEIQCHGENGKYGTLRKLENGKYITNILLVDYSEYDEANRIYEKHLPEFCAILKNVLEQNKENILSFPYLSPQKDIRFILWSLISNVVWDFEEKINATISDKYFSDVTPARREFTCTAVAYESGSSPNFAFYGCDGIQATSIGNYKLVHIRNIYGKRIEKHFACGHNISQDPKLLMLLKAVGGMAADELAEDEKEIAAKAIECGYLRNAENVIEPNVIVIERENEPKFHSNLLITSNEQAQQLVRLIAEELAAFMRKHIPEHLMDEYPRYTQMIAGVRILSSLIEECIKEGLLSEPQNRLGAEGMLMVVEK